MLIEFKVANFQCFRDEVTVSLQPAGRDRTLRGNIWQGNRYQALKSVAIFGPNASGKTSLLHALYVLSDFVKDSATRMNVGDRIGGVRPFRLSEKSRSKPSIFEVLVEVDGAGYRYRVEATRERVMRERLERQDAAKGAGWLTMIDRDVPRGHCELHERMGGEARRRQIVEDTRENALILSRAAERNVDAVTPLFRWFSERVHHVLVDATTQSDEAELRAVAQAARDDQVLMQLLSELIRDADTGIVDLHAETTVEGNLEGSPTTRAYASLTEAGRTRHPFEGSTRRTGPPGFFVTRPMSPEVIRFTTEHACGDGSTVRFSLAEESEGTRRYMRLACALLRHLASADLLAIDELHASLHPHLSRRIVQMAHSPAFGSTGAQLLFSTHDAALLDPDVLRRDQIILTQKGPDGAAEAYSLWDFEKMPRNVGAWMSNYLAGRFGGVPVFGPALADIPQADEPTPITAPQPAPAAEAG